MSEDYKKGFKDGFAAGLEEGKKLSMPQVGWPTYPPITCGGSTPIYGAVGSAGGHGAGSVGANGEAGSMMGSRPTIEEEKNRLSRYNEVWINGSWASLGG